MQFNRAYSNYQVIEDSGYLICNDSVIFIQFGDWRRAFPLEKEYRYSNSNQSYRTLYIEEDGQRFTSLIEIHASSHINIRFYEPIRAKVTLYMDEIEDQLNLKMYNDLTAAEKADIRRNRATDCPYCHW